MSKTDIVLTRTMITDTGEHNEVMCRFVDYDQHGIGVALRRVADATDGLPLIDSMRTAVVFVGQYIHLDEGDDTYMLPAVNDLPDLFDTSTIHVEIISGITEYSRGELFNALIITTELSDSFYVADGLDLRRHIAQCEGFTPEQLVAWIGDRYNIRPGRSRQGYVEAAASEALHFKELA